MAVSNKLDLESIIFSYIDEFKFLFFPDQWSGVFLDYSKNEIIALLYLYRYKNANMTEISQYINAPLNTATGVVNRLEKKEMIERIRSSEDRRIVQITLTDKANEFLIREKAVMELYVNEINETLTKEEKATALNIIKKVREVLYKNKSTIEDGNVADKKVKKIKIE
jgi:MarR family transcriptional regulator, organic hydroperoxide resistance regulator